MARHNKLEMTRRLGRASLGRGAGHQREGCALETMLKARLDAAANHAVSERSVGEIVDDILASDDEKILAIRRAVKVGDEQLDASLGVVYTQDMLDRAADEARENSRRGKKGQNGGHPMTGDCRCQGQSGF